MPVKNFWCDVINGNLACRVTQLMSHLGSNVTLARCGLRRHCSLRVTMAVSPSMPVTIYIVFALAFLEKIVY